MGQEAAVTALCRALAIAAAAHDGQRDKIGEPYILHPLRVMLQLEDPVQRVVAVLHDVVEDSDWTLDGLRNERFPENVVAAVDAISRREGEDYQDYVRRAGENPVARAVKLADLRDNMRQTRLRVVTDEDRERLQRYRVAFELLEGTEQRGGDEADDDGLGRDVDAGARAADPGSASDPTG